MIQITQNILNVDQVREEGVWAWRWGAEQAHWGGQGEGCWSQDGAPGYLVNNCSLPLLYYLDIIRGVYGIFFN